jgi:hypothetical protein
MPENTRAGRGAAFGVESGDMSSVVDIGLFWVTREL